MMKGPGRIGGTIFGLAVAYGIFYNLATQTPRPVPNVPVEPYFIRHVSMYPEGPEEGDVWMDSKGSCLEYLKRFRQQESTSIHKLITSYCISVREAQEQDGMNDTKETE